MAYKKFNTGNFFKFTDPGDTLEGRWKGMTEGRYGMLGQLLTDDGKVAFPINKALEDLSVLEDGTLIKIVYTGADKLDNGQTFKKFDLFVDDEKDETSQDEVPF